MPGRGLESKYQGSKWCRRDLRLAIYLRDGLACSWCGDALEDGARLTLDHLVPHSQGGSNEATNLVTACQQCNSSRGDRSLPRFAKAVLTYLGSDITSRTLVRRIQTKVSDPIGPYRTEAKQLIARRGNYTEAVASLTGA